MYALTTNYKQQAREERHIILEKIPGSSRIYRSFPVFFSQSQWSPKPKFVPLVQLFLYLFVFFFTALSIIHRTWFAVNIPVQKMKDNICHKIRSHAPSSLACVPMPTCMRLTKKAVLGG